MWSVSLAQDNEDLFSGGVRGCGAHLSARYYISLGNFLRISKNFDIVSFINVLD